MKQRKLRPNAKYAINFFDPRQPDYTWYSGPATFLRLSDEDFGENEQHFVFELPDGDECIFPEQSVGVQIRKIS